MVGRLLVGTRAQATVEMALVVPVLLVLGLFAFNAMAFLSACARFDRVATDIVLEHGVASGEERDGEGISMAALCEDLSERIGRAMAGYPVETDVEVQRDGVSRGEEAFELVGELRTYRCALSFIPWPQGFSIAGVALGSPLELTHEVLVTVDPWRSGVVA